MCAGVTVIGEVNPLTAHLMNVLWMLGTFTFATVIGIITEDVTQTIMVTPPRSAHQKHWAWCVWHTHTQVGFHHGVCYPTVLPA